MERSPGIGTILAISWRSVRQKEIITGGESRHSPLISCFFLLHLPFQTRIGMLMWQCSVFFSSRFTFLLIEIVDVFRFFFHCIGWWSANEEAAVGRTFTPGTKWRRSEAKKADERTQPTAELTTIGPESDQKKSNANQRFNGNSKQTAKQRATSWSSENATQARKSPWILGKVEG